MDTLREALSTAIGGDSVADAIKAGKRILVVGTRAGNLPDALRRHPKIVEWDSDSEQAVLKARKLPDGVGAILTTRFLSHVAFDKVRELADAAGIYICPRVLGTGEIRRMLQPLVPSVNVVTPNGTPWTGTLYGFIEHHYEWDSTYGHQKREAERIYQLTREHGISTTLSSVQHTVGIVHRSIERERTNAQTAAAPPAPTLDELKSAQLDASKAKLPPPPPMPLPRCARCGNSEDTHPRDGCAGYITQAARAAITQQPVAAITTTQQKSELQIDESIGEVVRMMDDSIAVMQLAREHLLDLHAKNTALRRQKAEARARVMAAFDEI